MLGSQFQEKFDKLMADLATSSIGTEKAVDVAFRSETDGLQIITVTAENGVVNQAASKILQDLIDPLKSIADAFENAKVSYDLKNTSENYSALSQANGNFYIV